MRGKTGAAGSTPRVVLASRCGGFISTAAQRLLTRIGGNPVSERLVFAEMTTVGSTCTVVFITAIVHVQPDAGNRTAALGRRQQAGKVDLNRIVFIQWCSKYKGRTVFIQTGFMTIRRIRGCTL